MHRIASATFDIDSWDEQPWDDGLGARLTRTRVKKTFHGEIEGTSVGELLMAYAQDTASRAYVGFEWIVGTIGGKTGGFVLHHTATTSFAGQAVSWSVVPDSGTGGLFGIRGEAQIVVTPDRAHAITLDYEPGLTRSVAWLGLARGRRLCDARRRPAVAGSHWRCAKRSPLPAGLDLAGPKTPAAEGPSWRRKKEINWRLRPVSGGVR